MNFTLQSYLIDTFLTGILYRIAHQVFSQNTECEETIYWKCKDSLKGVIFVVERTLFGCRQRINFYVWLNQPKFGL